VGKPKKGPKDEHTQGWIIPTDLWEDDVGGDTVKKNGNRYEDMSKNDENKFRNNLMRMWISSCGW